MLEAVEAARDRLFALLSGQKDVLEQIARGVPLPVVLDQLVRLIEEHLAPDARATVHLADDAAPPAEATGFSVPILASDQRVLGTLALDYDPPREPSDSERQILSALVETAAVAVERHRDLTALMREKRSVEALNRVGQAITARLKLDEIVQLATDAATDLTKAAFGAFFYNVIGQDGLAYQLYTLSGASRKAFERYPMPRKTEIFGPTFDGTGTLRLHDVTEDARFGRNDPYNGLPEGHLPVRSYLAVPVVTAHGEVAGGLFFGHPEPGVFDAEAERVAEGIAAQAAIAIENARLFDAAQRELDARRRAFEERDRVARLLSKSLLPDELPAIEGVELAARYRACIEGIGGDFYDVFPLAGDHWGLVIGDVCGKGAEAAALTSLARHTVRAAAMIDPRPAQVLRVLNRALRDSHESVERFCTAVYALLTIRPDSVCIHIARGGHPSPLVARAGGVVAIESAGTVLGVLDDPGVAEERVELAPGDVVVLYTDGVTDVGADSTVLGEEWLRETVAASRAEGADVVAHRLALGAAQLQQSDHGRDDIAVLVLGLPA